MESKLILGLFAGCLASAKADIELSGILKTKDGPVFAVADVSQESPARWVSLGATVNQYKLLSYDETQEIIVVEKDGTKTVVKLKSARISPPKNEKEEEAAVVNFSEMSESELNSLGFHKVTPGNTGSQIAKASKLTLPELLKLNPGVDFSKIKIGQIVRIRAAQQPKEEQAPVPPAQTK